MITRRGLAGGAIGLSTAAAARAATAAPAQSKTRAAEAMALRRFVEARHPDGARARLAADWNAGWDQMIGRADRLGLPAYLVELRRRLAWFGDGHTTVLPFEFLGAVPPAFQATGFGRRAPLRARAFHDGIWIIEAGDEAAPLLGRRIVEVNGLPAGELMRRHAAAWPCESPAWAHNWAGLLFSSMGLVEGLGAAEAGAPLMLRTVSGSGEALQASLRPRAGARPGAGLAGRPPSEVERYAAEIKRGNYVRAADGELLVSIDEMADLDAYPMTALLAELRPHLKAGAGRLILDLRRNGGGDNYLGEGLRKEIARSGFNRPGGLYVLTGPQTFSAAQDLANRLERETFARFVGEPTGSAPNLHGDPEMFTGPVTGLTAMVSTLTWADGGPHDRRRFILPDIPAPVTFADWAAGRDRALAAARADQVAEADDFTARARYFERPSQKADWRPFWRNFGDSALN